jgi:hypothetical protein
MINNMQMRALYIVILLCIYSCIVNAQQSKDKEANEVKVCFASYRQAILEGKGSEAIKWTDSRTLSYYAQMLDFAFHADSLKVQDLSMIDKLMVFTVRHRIPKEEALVMKGTSFFVYAVDQGMIGKNSVVNITLGEVKVEGNFAQGEIISNGKKAPFYFHFNKENKEWKIDLTSIFPATNMGLKKVVADSGQSEADFILNMLEITTGRKPKPTIWKPLKQI